jgi:hypothetical protein
LIEFTDDDLVRLVSLLSDESADDLASRGHDPVHTRVSVRDVARRLLGLDDAAPTPPEPGDLVRIGKALGRLAREGRIEAATATDRFRYSGRRTSRAMATLDLPSARDTLTFSITTMTRASRTSPVETATVPPGR